jgi:hypothetical protein
MADLTLLAAPRKAILEMAHCASQETASTHGNIVII